MRGRFLLETINHLAKKLLEENMSHGKGWTMRKLSDLRNMRWKKLEIQRARESEFDSQEDRIAEAIRDGVLGPVSWSFIDLLTQQDMDLLSELRISWRDDDGR